MEPPDIRVPLQQPRLHTGPIHSGVAGRTDHLPMHVPNGAYVLPADIVSALGEGNTVAGFKVAKKLPKLFATSFYGTKKPGAGLPYHGGAMPYGGANAPHSTGGSAQHEGSVAGVPIVAAGGEFIYSPEDVATFGGGDVDHGHKTLDAFIKHYRSEVVSTLKALPGPRQD